MTNKIYQRLQKKRPRYYQEHNDTFCLFCLGTKKNVFWDSATFNMQSNLWLHPGWKYFMMFNLQCNSGIRIQDMGRKIHYIHFLPGSLQILVSSFLVFLSFCLRDFLFFKFPFACPALLSKKVNKLLRNS